MTDINEVPWLIEGGALHTANVARNLGFMAAGGKEGIVLGADCEVRELAVPGSSVRVFPGTCAVRNRAAGTKDEMYVMRVPTEVQVDIASTGTSGRSDMIVARVKNPYAPGETWPEPGDPTVGPYAEIGVISNVGSGARTVEDLGMSSDHSMLPLARVDIPANTSTFTQGMVTDLRKMSASISERHFEIIAPTTTETLTQSEFVNWPDEAHITVDVPEWATHARTRAILAGIEFSGNVWGQLRIQLEAYSAALWTQATSYNLDSGGGKDHAVLMCGSPRTPIPKTDRGKPGMNVLVEGVKFGGTTSLESRERSMISLEIEFIHEPESNV